MIIAKEKYLEKKQTRNDDKWCITWTIII
jgi:hypothetical protein